MVRDRSALDYGIDIAIHGVLVILALACVLPLVHILAVSLSDRASAMGNLVGLWPVNFTTFTYESILGNRAFTRAFLVSINRVLLGTIINVVVVVLTAYPLSLSENFRGKSAFKWLLIFAWLFSGGLIPWFLAIRSLHLLNTIWALVLPGAIQMWSIIIVLNFFRGLPPELAEAATMDGASHLDILLRIYVQVSLPALATITLFSAVGHWNSWFDGLVLMTRTENYPLQTYLQTTLVRFDTQALFQDPLSAAKLSERAMRAAQIMVATFPILAVYPLLQRYFIHGLTLGSVKG